MTFQHDADGVPDEGTQSETGDSITGKSNGDGADDDGVTGHSAATAELDFPQHGRALLALVAAGTLAVAPIAGTVIGPAGSGNGAHSSPVFLLAEVSHDIGHNDWAYQGGLADRIIWVITYVALAVAWFGIALWIRMRDRRAAKQQAQKPRKLWLRALGAALGAELAAGLLTIGAGLYAQWTATDLGPIVLRLVDVCSPWWSCVAALVVAARAERSTVVLRAALAYGAVLALVLLVPFPGPSDIKVLILTATVAVPALLDERAAAVVFTPIRSRSRSRSRPDAAAAG